MIDMIPFLEVRPMVSSFHKHLKGQELVHLKSVYKILLSVHQYLFQNIDLKILSKDVSALQRLKSSWDIFFLLGILLRNLVVAASEVASLV